MARHLGLAERTAGASFALAGVVLGVGRYVGASDPERSGEGALSCVAYGIAVAAPGLVALLGRQGIVTIGAAVAGFGVAFLASFGVTLPLLVPAAMLLSRGMKDLSPEPGDGVRALLVTVAIPWAVVILYAHDDPVSTARAFVSDVTVWWESTASLALSGLALVASGPRAHDREDRVGVGTAPDE